MKTSVFFFLSSRPRKANYNQNKSCADMKVYMESQIKCAKLETRKNQTILYDV